MARTSKGLWTLLAIVALVVGARSLSFMTQAITILISISAVIGAVSLVQAFWRLKRRPQAANSGPMLQWSAPAVLLGCFLSLMVMFFTLFVVSWIYAPNWSDAQGAALFACMLTYLTALLLSITTKHLEH
jgi:uncharacterized membrane protein YuzA (DUF378 family)